MLSTPKDGWSTLKIGDWSDRVSYIQDVPFMLLETLEQSCREHRPMCVKFDAEGYLYIVIFDWLQTHIITENLEKHEYCTTININRDDLAMELIADIKRNLDSWARWTTDRRITPDHVEERRKDLLALCDILGRRTPSNDITVIYRREEEE